MEKRLPSISKSHGKVHDYLGIKLNFSKPGEEMVTMIDYIKVVLHNIRKGTIP